MTRLPDGVLKPAKIRLAIGDDAELVLELTERTVTLRPKRARDPSAAVTLRWGSIYTRGLMAAAEEHQRAKRAKARRKR